MPDVYVKLPDHFNYHVFPAFSPKDAKDEAAVTVLLGRVGEITWMGEPWFTTESAAFGAAAWLREHAAYRPFTVFRRLERTDYA